MCVSCVCHVCVMCVSCVCHVCVMCVSCVCHVCVMCVSCVCHVCVMCVSSATWLVLVCYTCNMTYSHTTWLIHTQHDLFTHKMTYSRVCHVCVMCAKMHSCVCTVCHDLFTFLHDANTRQQQSAAVQFVTYVGFVTVAGCDLCLYTMTWIIHGSVTICIDISSVTVLCDMTYSCYCHNKQYFISDFCCSVVRDSIPSLFILILHGLHMYTTATHYTSSYSKLHTHITATLVVNTIHHSKMNELDAYSLHTLMTAYLSQQHPTCNFIHTAVAPYI